jgi:hypothetical protein
MSFGVLLVGGGHVELPDSWDAGPLVLAFVVSLGMRAAGIPLRPVSMLSAIVAGLVADVALGVVDLSLLPAVSTAMVVVSVIGLQRAHHHRRRTRGV